MTLIVILYIATFATEVAGLALLVLEARSSTALLRKWKGDGPEDDSKSSWGQHESIGPVVTALIGSPRRRWIAVALIGAGIFLGFASNILSLAI